MKLYDITVLPLFLRKYIKKYFLKSIYTAILHTYQGVTKTVDIADLKNMMFLWIPGDNADGYKRFKNILQKNMIVYNIATKNKKIMKLTPFCEEGFAYLHIVFDKVYTPFDNCVDLFLLLFQKLQPIPLDMLPYIPSKMWDKLVNALAINGYKLYYGVQDILYSPVSQSCILYNFQGLKLTNEDKSPGGLQRIFHFFSFIMPHT